MSPRFFVKLPNADPVRFWSREAYMSFLDLVLPKLKAWELKQTSFGVENT